MLTAIQYIYLNLRAVYIYSSRNYISTTSQTFFMVPREQRRTTRVYNLTIIHPGGSALFPQHQKKGLTGSTNVIFT